jgi:dynamin GTPase
MATQTASERFAGAMENLILLADTMQQAAALISGDEDGEEAASRSSSSSFMNVVPLGNVGAGKSAVLNSLVGHPVLVSRSTSLSNNQFHPSY